MVEQEAVNFEVTGSSPVAGAKIHTPKDTLLGGLLVSNQKLASYYLCCCKFTSIPLKFNLSKITGWENGIR